MHTLKRSSAIALTAMMALAGCSGSDGKNGAAGAPGADLRPPMTAETCVFCHQTGTTVANQTTFHDNAAEAALAKGTITITSATFPTTAVSKPTITFTFADHNGDNVADWRSFNFTIAQLVPATAATPEHWESFVWRTRTGWANGTPDSEIGGDVTSTTAAKGTLSYAGGVYTYVFATDLKAPGTAPSIAGLAPTYDPAATIRIGVQVGTITGATSERANGVADFVPNTGAVALAREIVTTAACNACHGKLAIHGGGRVEANYCVTCHNAQLVDDTGRPGDLGPYVHKIHGREKLTDPTAKILMDLVPEEFTYPQDIINCATCHKGTAGARWNTNPSRYACGSCHDNISWAATVPTGFVGHPSSQTSKVVCVDDGPTGCEGGTSGCTDCHSATGIQNKHKRANVEEAKKLKAEIGTVTYTAATNTLTAQFRIVDPTNANLPYALTHSYFTRPAGASTLTALIAFANSDFKNAGATLGTTATTYGQPINVNLLAPTGTASLSAQDAGTGYYTLTLTSALPVSATDGSLIGGTIAIQGHPSLVDDGNAATSERIPMTNVSKNFTIVPGSRNAVPAARRTVVDIAKCNACHANLSLHGNNRTGDITTCTTCHNTEATDGSRRTAGVVGIDGKLQEGIDFKYMIHSIHGTDAGAGIVVYGFNGSVNDFRKVTYPNVLSNCQACHVAGAYQLPADAANGTSTFAGADLASGADNLRITKGKATCGVCHTSGVAQSHIMQMGGTQDVTQAQIDAVNQ